MNDFSVNDIMGTARDMINFPLQSGPNGNNNNNGGAFGPLSGGNGLGSGDGFGGPSGSGGLGGRGGNNGGRGGSSPNAGGGGGSSNGSPFGSSSPSAGGAGGNNGANRGGFGPQGANGGGSRGGASGNNGSPSGGRGGSSGGNGGPSGGAGSRGGNGNGGGSGSPTRGFGPSSSSSGAPSSGAPSSGSSSPSSRGSFGSSGPAAIGSRGGSVPQRGANGEPVYVNSIGQLSTEDNAGFDPKKSFIIRPDKDSQFDQDFRIPSNSFDSIKGIGNSYSFGFPGDSTPQRGSADLSEPVDPANRYSKLIFFFHFYLQNCAIFTILFNFYSTGSKQEVVQVEKVVNKFIHILKMTIQLDHSADQEPHHFYRSILNLLVLLIHNWQLKVQSFQHHKYMLVLVPIALLNLAQVQ